ncbi:hypothetical protein MNY64_14385 [Moellerella wisconsensis]|nr:hypothetical protein [Moellerella wisconsensis]UNH28889.1 hypothetical protein MNY64_14385 [Moellerella wisconsensis]
MKREILSPAYTTRVIGLPNIRI